MKTKKSSSIARIVAIVAVLTLAVTLSGCPKVDGFKYVSSVEWKSAQAALGNVNLNDNRGNKATFNGNPFAVDPQKNGEVENIMD